MVDIQNYLDSIYCGKITYNEKKICDDIPTFNECKTAVENMKNNKSPGLDGLPAEFYKAFLGDIIDIYYESLIKSTENGILPFSPKKNLAIMTLISKKGEKDNPKNNRPLILTNTDYKIFAHVLANRLQKIASRLIGREQSA